MAELNAAYSSMEILSLVYIVILLISVFTHWHEAAKSTRIYALDLIVLVFGLICDYHSIVFPVSKEPLLSIFTYLSLMFGALLVPIFAYYCISEVNEHGQVLSIWYARGVQISIVITMIICTVSFAQGKLFGFEPDATMIAGTCQMILHVVELTSMLLITVAFITCNRHISKRGFVALLIFAIVPCVAALTEAFFPRVVISYTALSASAFIQYAILQSQKLAESKVKEMVSIEMSRTDPMTGLQNRRAYSEFIDSLTEKVNAGVIFFDINGLKQVNDEKGHTEGDKLILRFADILRQTIPEADLFRISGDEFVAVFDGPAREHLFRKGVEKLQHAISESGDIAAMGSVFGSSAEIADLVNTAEKLMYDNKNEYYQRTGNTR